MLNPSSSNEQTSLLNGSTTTNSSAVSRRQHVASFVRSMRSMSQHILQHMGQIGTLGSVSIAVNFLTGPAMLELPAVFKNSGIIPTTATILLVGLLSALCSLHMAQAISQLHNNTNFSRQVEYSQAFWEYIPRLYPWTQVTFFGCVTCLNLSSLVDSAQVWDGILANTWGETYALQIIPTVMENPFHWVSWSYSDPSHCSVQDMEQGRCIPFLERGDGDDDGVILTAGYIFNIVCFMPLALVNLQENAAWQVVEFVVLIVTSIVFSCLFWEHGLHWRGRLSWWGDSWEDLMGVVLFNFALVISIPAWLYEKETSVDARKVIVGSSGLAALLYIVLGILGAMSMPHVSDNMLETFLSGTMGTAMQWNASIFALFIVGLGIPLLSVLCRLNLTGSGISKRTGDLLAVYFPFGVAWLLYRGDLVTQLLSWGGIIFTSLIAFVFPIVLAKRALIDATEDGSIMVYGERCKDLSEAQSRSLLNWLLGICLLSIALAVVGNILG